MKIILLQDVAGTGRKWEAKDVKGGYARNYLLPAKLAVLATPKTVKGAELKRKQEAQKRTIQEELFEKSLESLRNFTFIVEKKVNEKGHLYDALDVKEIVELLKEKLGGEIPLKYIRIEKPIKEIGRHKITVPKRGPEGQEVSFEIEIKPKED